MNRRDVLKLGVLTGATATLASCEKPAQQLIRFVPEEDFLPGIATWKPSLCTVCPAGCGMMVRIVDGEAEVVRNGQLGIINMGLAKKLEGNPKHPVNRGKLCARGQAGLQITYHPDRVRTPLKRFGQRGSGVFHTIGWETALSEIVVKLQEIRSRGRANSIRFLTDRVRGRRRELINNFLGSIGAPPALEFDPLDEPVLRRANLLDFGRPVMPSFDFARSNYVISFGADFLGAWNSPVAQSIGYGEMRRGRPGNRGKFVQVEQRMSQTGANADEWVPSSPGTEGLLALGLAHSIVKERLRPKPHESVHNPDWAERLTTEIYSPTEVEKRTGVAASSIERLAREMASHIPAVALIGGAALAHTNGLFSALAVNLLNRILGSVGAPGGIFFAPGPPITEPTSRSHNSDFFSQLLSGGFEDTEALFLYKANPVFATPPGFEIGEKLTRTPFSVSFSSFIDETSVFADLILPDHSPLESWLDDVPESGTSEAVLTLARPVMHPLHDTRAMPDVVLEIANRLGGEVREALPRKTFEEVLKASYSQLARTQTCNPTDNFDKLWEQLLEQGGWWDGNCQLRLPEASRSQFRVPEFIAPVFDGSEQEFPFYFQPYLSGTFLDGSLAHLPWMQELPDALSTVMWGSWLEVNPKTAERLQIQPGDLVRVRSRHGTLEAPAIINPGIAFDVAAMPMGQGHENFGRYASLRGANPMKILAPTQVREVDALAWAATRVNLSKVGQKGRLALFSGALSEQGRDRELR